jgi:predicted nucleic-acid-binding Zn-ribbon protein
MKIEYEVGTVTIDIASPKLKYITEAFFKLQKLFLQQFFQNVLLAFAEYFMSLQVKPFGCDKCSNRQYFKWKTRHGKKTSLLTIFGQVMLKQFQVQCKQCGHKMYLIRKLLGERPRKRIPFETVRKLGLLGALTSFRVADKITSMFGWQLDKMTIWRSVQKVARTINFDLDVEQQASGEADGTGIPIRDIEKRGKELKVFVQHKKQGGVRVAGLAIGNYNGGWDQLFKPLLNTLEKFKQFLLITDGESSILQGLKTKITILYQRCLWHVPYQFKYYLWQDKVTRKSEQWLYAFSKLLNICAIRSLVKDTEVTDEMLNQKMNDYDELIDYCIGHGWEHCVVYLQHASDDLFTSVMNRLHGKTTSHVERVMRTVNMRINVGKWSPQGALNAVKVRLAYYYNDFDA